MLHAIQDRDRGVSFFRKLRSDSIKVTRRNVPCLFSVSVIPAKRQRGPHYKLGLVPCVFPAHTCGSSPFLATKSEKPAAMTNESRRREGDSLVLHSQVMSLSDPPPRIRWWCTWSIPPLFQTASHTYARVRILNSGTHPSSPPSSQPTHLQGRLETVI